MLPFIYGKHITGRKPTTLESRVKRAIQELRFLFIRNPSIIEIAYHIGENPDLIKKVVFRFSPTMKWKEPTKEQIEEADIKLREIYEAVALRKYFHIKTILCRPTSLLYKEPTASILARIRYAQKYEQDKIPTIFRSKKPIASTNEHQIELIYKWPNKGRGNTRELYDRKNKQLSGILGYIKVLFSNLIEKLEKSFS
jgi:hypothetical protein